MNNEDKWVDDSIRKFKEDVVHNLVLDYISMSHMENVDIQDDEMHDCINWIKNTRWAAHTKVTEDIIVSIVTKDYLKGINLDIDEVTTKEIKKVDDDLIKVSYMTIKLLMNATLRIIPENTKKDYGDDDEDIAANFIRYRGKEIGELMQCGVSIDYLYRHATKNFN